MRAAATPSTHAPARRARDACLRNPELKAMKSRPICVVRYRNATCSGAGRGRLDSKSAQIVVEALDRARDSQLERGFAFFRRRGWWKRCRELYALSLHLVLDEPQRRVPDT